MSSVLKPFESYPRAFISYAHSDGAACATALRERIEREEPEITLWQDRTQMQGGVGWWKQITGALDRVEILIMVMTPAAMKSEIAGKEWRYARQQGVRVCPVMDVLGSELNFDDFPSWMRKRHFYDLEKEWETFVSFLKSPGKDNRVPFMAPDLLEIYVERPKEIESLLSNLLDESGENPRCVTAALQGSGGFGKTTLAGAVCHNENVISAFDDGILWVSLGESPNIQGELTKLYAALTGERPPFVDADDASIQLVAQLDEKNCLLVIDDVWDVNHLDPFLRGGKQCARLITTRQLAVATDSGVDRTIVDKMTEAQSVSMLTARLSSIPDDSSRLNTLAKKLGEWPLLLKLAASQLGERIVRGDSLEGALNYIERAMEKRGATAFDRANPNTRHDAIASSVAASLALLSAEDRIRFKELAVFPSDRPFPLSAARVLWELDDFDTEDLVQRLDGAALLDFDLKVGSARIHNVLRSYIESQLENITALHSRLVHQWCQDSHSLPDAYAWSWVGWHLVHAGEQDRLEQFLLDLDWLRARLGAIDIQTIIHDFELLEKSDDLRMVRDALRLASHGISLDPDQIYVQLMGRLSRGHSAIVDKLLDQSAALQPKPRLSLADKSLTHPGGPLRGIVKAHSGSVDALAVTADGRWAVSGSEDWTLRLWDLEKNQVVRTFEGHAGIIHTVAITPDGRLALSGSEDRTIRLWDLESGQMRRSFKNHTLAVQGVAITDDGKIAASVSEDGSVRLWDLDDGHSQRLHKGAFHQLNAIALDSQGHQLIFGAGDWTINVLSIDDGQVCKTLEGHSGVVRSLAITNDGKLLSGSDDGTLRVWDIDSGATLSVLLGHTASVDAVAVTADGKFAVSGSKDKTLRVWSLETDEEHQVLEGHSGFVKCVAVASTTSQILSGSSDGTIRLWDLHGASTVQSGSAHNEAVSLLGISANGRRIVSGTRNNNSLLVWSTDAADVTDQSTQNRRYRSPPEITGSLAGHRDRIRVLHIAADGETALTGSRDCTLRIWDLGSATTTKVLKGHTREIRESQISPDGKLALSLSRDQTLRIWDIETGRAVRALVAEDNERALSSLRVDSAMLAELDINPLVDTTSKPIPYDAEIALSASGDQAMFGTYGRVCLWDLKKGKTEDQEIQDFDVVEIAFDSSNQRALVGSLFGSLIVWDLKNEPYLLEGHSGRILDIVISSDGRSATTAAKDDTIRSWDLDAGQETGQTAGSFGKVDTVAMAPNGKIAYSVYGDTIVAYGLEGSVQLASLSFDHQITALAVTPNGESVAVGDQSGRVHLLHLEA